MSPAVITIPAMANFAVTLAHDAGWGTSDRRDRALGALARRSSAGSGPLSAVPAPLAVITAPDAGRASAAVPDDGI